MNDSKGKVLLLAVVILVLLSLLLVLFLVFRPVDNEDEIFEEHYGATGKFKNYVSQIFSKEDFKELKQATEEEKVEYEERLQNAAIGDYKIPEDLKMLGGQAPQFAEINAAIFSIAKAAMEQSTVDSVPEEYRDPIVILAQSVTEYLDTTNTSKVWVPAIPTRFLDDSEITVETLNSFNIARAVKMKNYRTSHIAANSGFQGPLQFSFNYGVKDNNPSYDASVLKYKSEAANLAADSTALALYKSGSFGRYYILRDTSGKDVGDRLNFSDSAHLAIQKWDYDYGRMKDEQAVHIKSMTSFVALVGMQHNVGESVITDWRDGKRTGSTKMCRSACNYGDMWDLVEFLGKPDVAAAIKAESVKTVENYMSTKTMTHISKSKSKQLLSEYAKGTPLANKIDMTKEGANHLVRIIYWYYVLHELYYNGDAYS